MKERRRLEFSPERPRIPNFEMNDESLIELWRKPTSAFRGKPFWAWNSKLEKDELIQQIHVFKEMGMGGFFMHSRTGLETEYLGDEWFELINACADEAERLGMEAWLYDEDRWPSGSAGGIATREPEYRMRYLRMERVPSEEFVWRDDYVAAFLCDLATFHGEGFQFSEGRRIDRGESGLEPGHVALTFHVELMDEDGVYNDATYLDTMNPAATAEFLRVTHERYKAKCGDRLGRSIKGIFTDEPHRGMVMSSFADHHHSSWVIPWTGTLAADFEERFGYDLIERLPEIFLQPFGQPLSQVKWHYMELIQRLFLDNFMKPVHAWCRENQLALTGHVLHEDGLVCQAVPNGSVIRNYEHMDVPGVDVLMEGNQKYWLAKQCQSAARQLGKPWVLSELYGCTGWQFTFQSHKEVGDWQALFGVNVRCHHLSWYTMAGESKRDYPASILHQSAWYEHYAFVEDYFSRINVFLQQGRAVCELLVVSPIESVWAQIRHGWVNHLVASIEPIQELERAYSDVFHWLAGTQMDFDYGDEDYLTRMGRVETTGEGPVLVVGEARYRAVLVAGVQTLRASTLDLLERFVADGGSVIVSGDAPRYVDAAPSDRGRNFFAQQGPIPFYQSSLTRACRAKVAIFAEAMDTEYGFRVPTIYAHARDTDQGRLVMMLRVERTGWKRDVLVRLRGEGAVEEWDARTGARRMIATEQIGEWLEFRADFGPSGEHLYRILSDAKPMSARSEAEPVSVGASRSVTGEFRYQLAEPNVCVLDRASYRIDGGELQSTTEILKVDRAVRSSLGARLRGWRMLQPWFSKNSPKPPLAKIVLRFEFFVETIPPDGVMLAIEKPAQYRSIRCNDRTLGSGTVDGWWVDRCFERLPVPTNLLRLGANAIELEVDFNVGTDLEAIYLLGDFGVRLAGVKQTLTSLPETLRPECVTTQGLPFYGGRLTYEIPAAAFTDGAVPEGNLGLKLSDFEAACAVVRAGSAESKLIAFAPFETDLSGLDLRDGIKLEVVLTRRNTFGPLHQLPRQTAWYGPENWITEGAAFSEQWVLWPAGLLAAPELVQI